MSNDNRWTTHVYVFYALYTHTPLIKNKISIYIYILFYRDSSLVLNISLYSRVVSLLSTSAPISPQPYLSLLVRRLHPSLCQITNTVQFLKDKFIYNCNKLINILVFQSTTRNQIEFVIFGSVVDFLRVLKFFSRLLFELLFLPNLYDILYYDCGKLKVWNLRDSDFDK